MRFIRMNNVLNFCDLLNVQSRLQADYEDKLNSLREESEISKVG